MNKNTKILYRFTLTCALLSSCFMVSSCKEPEPEKETLKVYVTDSKYGAIGDGETNDREAIQAAIDDVASLGGGVVILNEDTTFLTSNLFLRSNVELHFEDGAKLKQSTDKESFVVHDGKKYLKAQIYYNHDLTGAVAWNHTWYTNYPFIYAPSGTNNVKLTGNGDIELTRGKSCTDTIHMIPVAFYDSKNFEITDVTISQYSAYALQLTQCNFGLVDSVKIKGPLDSNGDGISIVNSQDLRITGCNIVSSDDSLYICSSYNDPRMKAWSNTENPQPNKNIEIDNNYCELTWDACKAFGFILWGMGIDDYRKVEVSNVYIHDNEFETMGIWNDDPYDTGGAHAPIKDIVFENNIIHSIQSNFYTVSMSDVTGFDCMTAMKNTDFEKTGDTYWVSRGTAGATDKDSVGQNGQFYGYIDNLSEEDSSLYQGIKLNKSLNYTLQARVQTSGDPVELFVENQETGEVIAQETVTNTKWEDVELEITGHKSKNYRIGIRRGDATKGWARIDDVNLKAKSTISGVEESMFDDKYPNNNSPAGQARNSLGTRFSTLVDGRITAVKVYTNSSESGNHIVSIWEVESKKMVTAKAYDWRLSAGTAGWKTFKLPEEVQIKANVDYIVSVTSGEDGKFTYGLNQLAEGFVKGNIVIPPGAGYYGDTNSMPTESAATNYFRDIVFISND